MGHGATEDQLLRTYFQQIRTITVWNGAITVHERKAGESPKIALAIIGGEQHTTYNEALNYFGLETLETRKTNLCITFALKANKSPKFSNWFKENTPEVKTRSEKLPLKKIYTRARRYRISPLPDLTDLLNTHLPKQRRVGENNHNMLNQRATHLRLTPVQATRVSACPICPLQRTAETECWYFPVLPSLSQGTDIIQFIKVMNLWP